MDSLALGSNWAGGVAIVLFLAPLALHLVSSYLFPSTSTVINSGRAWDIFRTTAKKRFRSDAARLLQNGFEKSPDAFRILTDNGPLLVLSPRYAREVRSDDRLSLDHFIASEFHPDIPGFEPFKLILDPRNPLNTILKTSLTQALAYMTEDLSVEVADALSTALTDDSEWHEISPCQTALKLVAQMASKAFIGPEKCRDPKWHNVIITYTHNVYRAAQALHFWPKFLRPIVARFLPACQTLQAQIAEAREILEPLVAQRRADRACRAAQGKPVPSRADVIDWLEDSHGDQPYDPVAAQLLLSFAAIHGTSNLLAQALMDLCTAPDLIRDIRAEITSVLGDAGLTRAALYRLKLMDSALKESQRLAPNRLLSMGRIAQSDMHLSDGLRIPRGTTLMVSAHAMWEPEIYPDPRRYDGYRFYKLRQVPGQEGQHQLVSATEKHMGFGYGKHACPGRFFAAAEIKVALCHILLKYDLEHRGGGPPPRVWNQGIHLFPDPTARIRVRRRKEEISL
ncbi:Dihydroorotase [Aspergillus fumigatus]|nr:Dihydroorotase [Aspergillus fumigatus]